MPVDERIRLIRVKFSLYAFIFVGAILGAVVAFGLRNMKPCLATFGTKTMQTLAAVFAGIETFIVVCVLVGLFTRARVQDRGVDRMSGTAALVLLGILAIAIAVMLWYVFVQLKRGKRRAALDGADVLGALAAGQVVLLFLALTTSVALI